MHVELLTRPAATTARVQLDPGETLTAEIGAMIAMSSRIDVQTATTKKGGGGFFKAVKRMVGGENLFLNHFTANAPDQWIIIGPGLLGDVLHTQLTGGSMIVQGSSWMASDSDITIDATWQGLLRGAFAGEGMFWIKCTGTGDLLLNSFGAIYPIDVDGEYIVDTGHIVAFEDTLQFDLTKAGTSWVGSFLGGEGLVCKFKGQGKLWCQSHNPPSFGQRLGPMLKPR